MRVLANAPGAGVARATAFGLDVCSDRPVRCLEQTRAPATGRTLDLSVDCVAQERPTGSGRVICSRSRAGVETFRIVAESSSCYAIWGLRGGCYRLRTDAREARGHVGALPTARWERFLVGQVLPFASLLGGLEIFHASGVAIDGGVIAIAGESGAGKTSLALSLCAQGASFVTDDVLALECGGGLLWAHPGPPVAGIARSGSAIPPSAAGLSSPVIEDEGERVVRVERAANEPSPLRALFFLERRPDGPSTPCFEVVDDPRKLLAVTFNFTLATARRLRGLLDVCALASRLRVERIVASSSVEPALLAAAVTDRVRIAPSLVTMRRP